MSKIIAVDFDGTLCEYAFPRIGTQTAEQRELLEILIELKKEGYKKSLIFNENTHKSELKNV